MTTSCGEDAAGVRQAKVGAIGGTEWTAGQVAQAVGGRLVGKPDVRITSAAGLEAATETDLTFIRSAKFAKAWSSSKAGAALVREGVEVEGHEPSRRALIYVPDADMAMIRILSAIMLPMHVPNQGVHSTAVVDQTAAIAPTARVGAYCVIGPGCKVGEGTILHPGVKLGAQVTIGPETMLHAGVVVYDRCVIGAKCVLHSGVVIGADGFGFHPDPQGKGIIKIPHVGNVVLGNGVEIGANSCIDRGKFGATCVGDGTKIDNMVQIGHNVRIGRACLICGVTGIGGSVTIGDGVIIAGHCGIADGMKIGTKAIITAKSGVMNDVPAGATYSGLPAQPHAEQMRAWAATKQLADHLREARRAAKGKGPRMNYESRED